jgi:hypothetical protein
MIDIYVHLTPRRAAISPPPYKLSFPALPRAGDFFGEDEASALPIDKVWFQEESSGEVQVHILVYDDSTYDTRSAV